MSPFSLRRFTIQSRETVLHNVENTKFSLQVEAHTCSKRRTSNEAGVRKSETELQRYLYGEEKGFLFHQLRGLAITDEVVFHTKFDFADQRRK